MPHWYQQILVQLFRKHNTHEVTIVQYKTMRCPKGDVSVVEAAKYMQYSNLYFRGCPWQDLGFSLDLTLVRDVSSHFARPTNRHRIAINYHPTPAVFPIPPLSQIHRYRTSCTTKHSSSRHSGPLSPYATNEQRSGSPLFLKPPSPPALYHLEPTSGYYNPQTPSKINIDLQELLKKKGSTLVRPASLCFPAMGGRAKSRTTILARVKRASLSYECHRPLDHRTVIFFGIRNNGIVHCRARRLT
jgi:hypothetical protein